MEKQEQYEKKMEWIESLLAGRIKLAGVTDLEAIEAAVKIQQGE